MVSLVVHSGKKCWKQRAKCAQCLKQHIKIFDSKIHLVFQVRMICDLCKSLSPHDHVDFRLVSGMESSQDPLEKRNRHFCPLSHATESQSFHNKSHLRLVGKETSGSGVTPGSRNCRALRCSSSDEHRLHRRRRTRRQTTC